MSKTVLERHGTLSDYSQGCRCAACRAARREYDRDRERRFRPSKLQRLRVAIEALPVHQISGYEWECYEPDTGCHWHLTAKTPCKYGAHPIDHEGNYDRDGLPCDHQRLVDLDRILAIVNELGSESPDFD